MLTVGKWDTWCYCQRWQHAKPRPAKHKGMQMSERVICAPSSWIQQWVKSVICILAVYTASDSDVIYVFKIWPWVSSYCHTSFLFILVQTNRYCGSSQGVIPNTKHMQSCFFYSSLFHTLPFLVWYQPSIVSKKEGVVRIILVWNVGCILTNYTQGVFLFPCTPTPQADDFLGVIGQQWHVAVMETVFPAGWCSIT